jgi:hypothetical protein
MFSVWNPTSCAISIFLYLVTIKSLGLCMKDRPAFQLTGVMRAYNVTQILLCSYMCWGLYINPFENFFRINIPYSSTHEYFIIIHYLSKWLDFFDTIFMTLRKRDRQISFLHVFHHASIPAVWSLLLSRNEAFGTVTLGASINSAVHVMMYSHFLVTSFGFKNPLKKLVTQAQLVQFVTLLGHSFVALSNEKLISKRSCWVQVAYQLLMLFMFGKFYTRSYMGVSKTLKST